MGKYSYVYRGEVAPDDKGALWVHHEVFNDVSSPLVAEVYNGGSWSTLAGGSILEAIAAEEEKKKEEKEKEYQESLKEPLTFEAKEDDTKIYFLAYNIEEQTRTIEVSTDDGKTWTSHTSGVYDEDEAIIATLNVGEKALVRGDNPAMGYFSEDEGTAVYGGGFHINGEAYVYGNVMSLLDSTDFTSMTSVPEYAFTNLFCDASMSGEWNNNENLFSHPSKHLILPATTLSEWCYYCMFRNCESLNAAPELPAIILAEYCYSEMFQNCASLTTAPELPATTLADGCYNGMFEDCLSLITAPELPATTLADNCYSRMFSNCISLITAPKLPATTLANNCYNGMFSGCSGLTTAPELHATTLADRCYNSMFQNCTSLITAPELPATTLAEGCYSYMFNGCTRLSFVKCAFTTTPGSSYTDGWLANVFPVGLILKKGTWTITGDSGIPSGWTARSY